MIIVDRDLIKLIDNNDVVIESTDSERPFDSKSQIGAGSIDLRIGPRVRKYKKDVSIIDLTAANDTEQIELDPSQDFVIEPGELWIAGSLEFVILPDYIAAFLTGRSSIARLGLLVQCSQNFIHPGHRQMIPLQLINITNRPIHIKPYMSICQIVLLYTSSNAAIPYNLKQNAKYRNEVFEPEPSKIGVEFGVEKSEDFESSKIGTQDNNNLLEQVYGWKTKANEANAKHIKVMSQLKNSHLILFIVLGGSIGVVLYELDNKPFPTTKLIVAGAFILLSISIIYMTREGRK